MTLFYSGVAGVRQGKAKGVVIHNDAGSAGATAEFYRNWLPTHQAENGFAHVYIDKDSRYQPESYNNCAWHCANTEGNYWYVGWEICQSMGDQERFERNSEACFKDVANYMKSVGMVPNSATVKLHREFSATSCPHRTWALHGQAIEAVRAYYIAGILKYMGNSSKESTTQNKTKKKVGDIMLLFKENGKIYLLVGNKYTYVANPTHLTKLKTMMTKAGYDTWEHTDSDQIKYIKKIAEEAK